MSAAALLQTPETKHCNAKISKLTACQNRFPAFDSAFPKHNYDDAWPSQQGDSIAEGAMPFHHSQGQRKQKEAIPSKVPCDRGQLQFTIRELGSFDSGHNICAAWMGHNSKKSR